MTNRKGKVVSVLNQAPHHEDILCLIKHQAVETYGGRGIAPRILTLGSRWMRMFRFKPRPLCLG